MSPYVIPGLTRKGQDPQKVLEAISRVFDVPVDTITSGTTSQEKAKARWAFIWYMRTVLKYTPADIGKWWRTGLKTFIDHTTISRALTEGMRLMMEDRVFAHNIQQAKRVMMELSIEKYEPTEEPPVTRVTFDPDWLQKFIVEFLAIKEDAFSSKSHFARDRRLRSVALATFSAYSGMSLKDIAKRFFIPYASLWGYIKQGIAAEEYGKINAELKKYGTRPAAEYSNTGHLNLIKKLA